MDFFGGQRVPSLSVIQESPLGTWNLVLEFSLTLGELGAYFPDL